MKTQSIGRIQVTKRIIGYAYARNGNAHNPTPKVIWETFVDGKLVGTSRLKREAVALGNDVVADLDAAAAAAAALLERARGEAKEYMGKPLAAIVAYHSAPNAAPSWEATVRATPAALAYDAADNAAETSPCSICEKPLGMGHHTCHDCISARHADRMAAEKMQATADAAMQARLEAAAAAPSDDRLMVCNRCKRRPETALVLTDHSGAVCQDCMRAAHVQATGYTSCACRDCMELAIGPTGAMCSACTEALCDAFYTECRSPDAYGGDETEPQPSEDTSMSTPPTTVQALTSDTGSDASPTYYAVAREHVDTCRALKWAWISIRPYVLAVDCDPATAHHLGVQRAGHDDVLVLRVGGNDPWSEVQSCACKPCIATTRDASTWRTSDDGERYCDDCVDYTSDSDGAVVCPTHGVQS